MKMDHELDPASTTSYILKRGVGALEASEGALFALQSSGTNRSCCHSPHQSVLESGQMYVKNPRNNSLNHN